ncbi:MAG: hypothetical protein HEQ38_17330, partial [Gemmatimonas sp.]|nr:hypothetical protein [Gemmatimonas sp.]
AFKALDDAQKLRELDNREFQRERAQWEKERAAFEAEIARLTELTEAAGRIDVTENLGQDVLELRCVVSREALFLSRDPNEVFHASLNRAMGEFRAYVEEQRRKADARLAAAKAFSEARSTR